MNAYADALTAAGLEVVRTDFLTMTEAAQLKVTDDALTGMMKFITDKYNSLDFSEIEKSAGDIRKFKYHDMLRENAAMLYSIYENSPDSGAKKYVDVASAIIQTLDLLDSNRNTFSTLYKSGNGVIQLTYTSLVAACLYATGTLVSNTIRFVTTEQSTDCEVLFEEVPGTIRHVHIKNIMAVHEDEKTFIQLLNTMSRPENRKTTMSESITASGVLTALAVGGGIILLVPRLLMLIREIVYSIYYSRVKTSEMIGVQVDLIRTNIESLEAGRGNKKVIARQKKIADKLEAWKNKISLKMDTTEALKRTQMNKENAALRIDRNSPLVSAEDSTNGILL